MAPTFCRLSRNKGERRGGRTVASLVDLGECLRIESSQVRTVACAFVVIRSTIASARIFSSIRSCHWPGGNWVQ